VPCARSLQRGRQVLEIRQPCRVEFPRRHRLLEGASRLLVVAAIGEAAMPDERGDFPKTLFQIGLAVQGQAKAAYPGRIDEMAPPGSR
jgi:hypothetical protein